MSWINYLAEKSNYDTERYTKKKTDQDDSGIEHRASNIAILPSKRSLYTFQKAPMAHKTNSKEQFMFKFYFFKFTKSTWIFTHLLSSEVASTMLALDLVKGTFPAFETNLLFLKYYQFTFPYWGGSFYNFNIFVNSTRKTLPLRY